MLELKPLALVLFIVLAFSFVPFIAMQSAQALSAITFTNATTITSQGEQFQQVYENGTSSSIYLDANSSGFYFADSWDGNTLTSDSAQLSNTTYTIDSHAYISPVDLSRYSINFTPADQEYAQAANNTVYDVTTEDFWMAGMFKRTSDSGAAEVIFDKRAGSGPFSGYDIEIDSSDRLVAQINDNADSVSITLSSPTVSTNVWYAYGLNADRSGNGTLYLYNMDTGVLSSQTTDISSAAGSLTNTNTLTVGRLSFASANFFPGQMDNLIPPQIGQTLTQAQFLEYATTGLVTGIADLYDFNDGIGTVATDIIGSNDLSLFNTPTWSSDVTSASTSRPTIYVIGRDSDNSTNGVGKWNLADLSEVDDEYFSSDLAPLDIAQSTSNLYSTAINATSYGTLFDVSLTRSFGSYTETSIYTGDATTPAFGIHMDTTTGTQDQEITTAGISAVAELATASSVLLGDELTSITLRLLKEGTPPNDFTVGVMDASSNFTFECATMAASDLTTSAADYTFICPSGHTIAANDRIGVKYNDGDTSNNIHIIYSSTNTFDGTNTKGQSYAGSWSDGLVGSSQADLRMKIGFMDGKTIVYDGSPDTRYHFFTSGTDGDIRVIKRTGSTSLLATAMDHTIGEPFSVIQLTDRIIIQTATDTYQLLTATDAISLLHPNSFLSRPLQTFSISPAEREFNTSPSYLANASYAANIVPSTGATSRTGVFIQNVTTGGSGVLAPFEPDRYYYAAENDLAIYAEDGSNTWTIASLGTKEQVSVTAYSEEVGIDLIENSTAIVNLDVIKISCNNGNYLLEMQYIAVGSDSDCNEWWTFDESAGTYPRKLPYSASGEVVHADTYTGYTFEITQGDPTVFELTSSYDGKNVDHADFDSSGQLLQSYLFGNCYDVTVENKNTGSQILFGDICANTALTKSISLASITIPENWFGVTWYHNATRDYSDDENNSIRFDIQKKQSPYNVSIHIVDHIKEDLYTYDQWFNYTNRSNMTTIVQSGFFSNQTLYITAYENGVPVASDILGAKSYDIPDIFSPLGDFFGVPMVATLVVGVAALWRKENAYFGIIVTLATAGILFTLGMFEVDPAVWAVVVVIAAVGILMGVKRT